MKNLVRLVVILAVAALATIQARATQLANETFTYADGNLPTVSGGTWVGYSGLTGTIGVVSDKASLVAANALDAGIGFTPSGGDYTHSVLYAGFDVNFSAPGGASPAYFALFKDASTFNFVSRVWAGQGSSSSFAKLGIGNGSTAPTTAFTGDLTLGTTYRVVIKLDQSGATTASTMWINPTVEGDPSIAATDVAGAALLNANVVQFGLRQASGSGSEAVDNLLVGTTFADVVAVPEPSTIMLLGTGLLGLLAIRRRRS